MSSGTADESSFGARLAAIDAASGLILAAARGIDDLRDHPGVLRGCAADAGDGELTAAIEQLATSWAWGLEVVGGEAERWAALLQTVSDTYRQADRTAFWHVHLPGSDR